MSNDTHYLTRGDAKILVQETLTQIGLDLGDPTEIQRDMAWVRTKRNRQEAIFDRGLFTAIGVLVTAAVGAAWTKFSGFLS